MSTKQTTKKTTKQDIGGFPVSVQIPRDVYHAAVGLAVLEDMDTDTWIASTILESAVASLDAIEVQMGILKNQIIDEAAEAAKARARKG